MVYLEAGDHATLLQKLVTQSHRLQHLSVLCRPFCCRQCLTLAPVHDDQSFAGVSLLTGLAHHPRQHWLSD